MTKSILITGAASGIGLAVAKRFKSAGWQLGLLDLDVDALQEACQTLGSDVWSRALNVCDDKAVEKALADFARSHNGQLHVLLNSAGVLTMGRFVDVAMHQHKRTVDINVSGLMNMCYYAFPYLKNTKGACVINMSSASAIYGIPELASYSASKFAVRGFTEGLSIEWQDEGIRVCDVMPPFVDTPMVNKQVYRAPALSKLGVKLSPEDIADQVWESANAKCQKTHYPISNFLKANMLMLKVLPDSLARLSIKLISR
ncbi:MAG: short-chain dehydrogenase [Moraxellaceae bacterium]|nr:MAG: short-chain dehydrogenase [Moraxellaceae bacterium]